MNNNHVIQSLWVGSFLSPMEQMCIRSYLRNGHAFHLYVYEPIENIPEGTIVRDANEVLPRSEIYKDAFGGYVSLSNQFRYAMLYKVGGWWVDMDTVCLKPFEFSDEYVFSSENDEFNNRILVNTTFIKSQPGAKVFKDCLDFIHTRGHRNIHWGELGVNLISRMIFRNKLQHFVRYPDFFCPISYQKMELLIGPATGYRLPEISYAIHWWNEVWKRRALDKSGQFPEDCLYRQMQVMYSGN